MVKKKTSENIKKDSSGTDTCSLCGQLYNNFAFKGGYICESCLRSIQGEEREEDDPSEDS
ncbi:hypothetical protein NE619_14265 [Anaerovorax odorimutans]|uniref:Uncharacterized protein n=1 Tax=Anaerovorax odorimutans TaxID=109327 RepID=A0ABT1RRS9_9FIRM|nr:hypothetical protein [Anaerovorax odorimutans]MCQ4637896.1 hypothetical protein [Anaerovorax odorimutans]